MSQLANPFGLRPVQHPSGIIRPAPVGQIATGYATDIFQNSPILIDANGFVTAAAPASRIMGAFQGVEWTDSDGRRRYSNRWTANTVGTAIVAWYTYDQKIVYEIQANATLTLAAMGQQYPYTALSGNTTTGLSSIALNVAGAAANAALRVVGIVPAPDNDWGDPFPIVLVEISQHQIVADVASY